MRCKKCAKTFRDPPHEMRETQICGECSKHNFPTRDEVKEGSSVLIEKKRDQGTGILTLGIVQDILTPGNYHPNGLMVDLENGERGRVKKITGSIKQDSSYAAKIFTKNDELNKIPNSNEEINVNDISVSKYQAKIIIILSDYFSEKPSENNFEKFVKNSHSHELEFIIKDNWGSIKNFYQFATSFERPNQISLIIGFENLKKKLGRVPKHNDVIENSNSNFSIKDYEDFFQSWEGFLDLLGYEPWIHTHKNQRITDKYDNISKLTQKKSDAIVLKKEKFVQMRSDKIAEQEERIQIESNQTIEEIENELMEKFGEDSYFKEIFPTLKTNLDILPKNSIFKILNELKI